MKSPKKKPTAAKLRNWRVSIMRARAHGLGTVAAPIGARLQCLKRWAGRPGAPQTAFPSRPLRARTAPLERAKRCDAALLPIRAIRNDPLTRHERCPQALGPLSRHLICVKWEVSSGQSTHAYRPHCAPLHPCGCRPKGGPPTIRRDCLASFWPESSMCQGRGQVSCSVERAALRCA